MIIRIRESDFLNVTPIRKWLEELGIYENDYQYQFEWYGFEFNGDGDLEFYPIINFKQDNLLSGPELTEFILRWGV